MKGQPSNQTLYQILVRIEKKVDRTNGRVRALEIWRGVITGGLLVISGIVIPIVIKIFF